MEAVVIVTVLVLAQYIFFGIKVGSSRGSSGIAAPAIVGDGDFERAFRVHQNTMEQLVVLLPAMWLFAYFVNPLWAAGFGLIYIVGRFIYRAAYLGNPKSRSTGFMISFLPSAVMLTWVLIASVRFYF